jgi:hypothetical protein
LFGPFHCIGWGLAIVARIDGALVLRNEYILGQ